MTHKLVLFSTEASCIVDNFPFEDNRPVLHCNCTFYTVTLNFIPVSITNKPCPLVELLCDAKHLSRRRQIYFSCRGGSITCCVPAQKILHIDRSLTRVRNRHVGITSSYELKGPEIESSRSHWPSGIMQGYAADRLLGLRV